MHSPFRSTRTHPACATRKGSRDTPLRFQRPLQSRYRPLHAKASLRVPVHGTVWRRRDRTRTTRRYRRWDEALESEPGTRTPRVAPQRTSRRAQRRRRRAHLVGDSPGPAGERPHGCPRPFPFRTQHVAGAMSCTSNRRSLRADQRVSPNPSTARRSADGRRWRDHLPSLMISVNASIAVHTSSTLAYFQSIAPNKDGDKTEWT
jgi:hypothetical protein